MPIIRRTSSWPWRFIRIRNRIAASSRTAASPSGNTTDPNNARQTPKLPDRAVVDITKPVTPRTPGGIAAAGFFGEDCRLRGSGRVKGIRDPEI